MGLNVSGLVINHNYDRSIKNLDYDFGWGIEVIEETDFGEIFINWKNDEDFGLYFSDKGTLIFFSHKWVDYKYKSSHSDTLNYAYSAGAMVFQFDLFRSGNLVRSILDIEGDRHIDYGKPLSAEKNFETGESLILHLIDKLLGHSVYSIDSAEMAYRCKATQTIDVWHR